MIPDIADRKKDLDALCRRYSVRRLELFGSAVAGGYDPNGSDLDFLVEFEPLADGTYANTYFGLLEELEGLFGRSIDLVVDSAIRNPYFRQSVEQSKTLLYGA